MYYLLNRYTVTVLNLLLMALLVLSLKDLIEFLMNEKQKVEEMLKIVGGMGTIMLTYGIVLEEREALMHIFDCYPEHKTPNQSITDSICRDAGTLLLVVGLLMEVDVVIAEIPNSILNTKGHENIIVAVGGFLLVITLLHFVIFCYKLLTLRYKARQLDRPRSIKIKAENQ